MNSHEDGAWVIVGNRWDALSGREPQSPPSVSIIIAHYCQPAQLDRTLRAVERQKYPRDKVQVIVVDDGSPHTPVVPKHVQLLRQADAGFRLGAARNYGAVAAHNDVLVFLDADTSPEPDYLHHITRLPGLSWDCVVVGRRRHATFDTVPATARVEIAGPAHELPEPQWLTHGYRNTHNLLRANDRSYRYVIGAVVACTRRFFAETRGFDESFTSYGGEDWEWAYRAWLQGAVLAHVPEAVAWHDGPDKARNDLTTLASKNSEAIKLAGLIPVAGSRPHSLPPDRADIIVTGPGSQSTPGQMFVSLDSVIAELPGAVVIAGPPRDERFDRVRINVVVERPVHAFPGSLTRSIAAIESGMFAEVVLRDTAFQPLIRFISRREHARRNRWGSEAVLPHLDILAEGIDALTTEVDVEAYLGRW